MSEQIRQLSSANEKMKTDLEAERSVAKEMGQQMMKVMDERFKEMKEELKAEVREEMREDVERLRQKVDEQERLIHLLRTT